MTRLQSVRENWTEITSRLKSDKQELAQFLRFSAGMYKMSFPDAALIYYQNPNASKVAELVKWNQLGRLVNKGESSIAVFGKDNTCRHYFDISQTNGKRVPELWKLTEDLSAELTAVINQKYGKSCKNMQETIAAMAVDNIRVRLPDIRHNTEMLKLSEKQIAEYQQSVVSAVRFVVSNRCELDGDMKLSGAINLNAVDSFKDNRDLIRFCDLVGKSAKDTLLEMEREVIQILKQRREKTHEQSVQIKSDRAVSDRNTVHGRSAGTGTSANTNRQMGQAVAGVDGNRVSDGGDGSRHDGQVANHTEGNRQGSGGTLSGTGQAVPQRKSPSGDVHGDSAVGENAPADNRTSGDERNRVPAERITVDFLIDRYNDADFNRRFDSYEYAGWILDDTKATEFRLDAIKHFNKFHASDFSALQAEEIRNLIETALKNRELAQDIKIEKAEKTVDSVSVTVEAVAQEPEPVIMQNTVVDTSSLPPLTDENLIFGIIKSDRFLKDKREKIVAFFADNQDYDKRTEYIKSIYNKDYTELYVGNTRVGYKANENGLMVWEGNFLSRTKESGFSWDLVQSFTADLIERGEYLDKAEKPDLKVGDIVMAENQKWRVAEFNDFHIKLENTNPKAFQPLMAHFGNWRKKLDYTLVSEPIVQAKPEIPVIKEDKKQQDEWKHDEVKQLSFFGEPEPIAAVKPEKHRTVNLPSYAITQDMIDYALKCGSNEPHSLVRICGQFQKSKSTAENAEFLKKEFGVDGRGFSYINPENTHNLLIAAWYDKSGLTLGAGTTAHNPNSSAHLSWEQVSERISELLEKGEYTSQDNIDRAAEYELKAAADKLWYLHQHYEGEKAYFVPEQMFKGGFPDSTARITASMTDKATLQKYIDGLTDFIRDYEQDRDIMRFHFHKPKEVLQTLKDLQLERREFLTKPDFAFTPKYFITEDEKDNLLLSGSSIQDGKFRIDEFFRQEHTPKEKADFLKHEYGTGGSGRSGFDTWHDSKGLKYRKGSMSAPDAEILMKWTEVSKRIQRLVDEDRYISQADIDERIRHAKYTLKNYSPTNEIDAYHIKYAQDVLAKYGVQAEQPTPAEQQETRQRYIQCETPGEANTLFHHLNGKGYTWVDGEYLAGSSNNWYLNLEDTVYILNETDETLDISSVSRLEKDGVSIEKFQSTEFSRNAIQQSIQQDDVSDEKAVFMDVRDESFIAVRQVDEGIDYAVYAPDLSLIESGVWEMDEGMDLKSAAADLLATTETALAEIENYDRFIDLADINTTLDVPAELIKLKNAAMKTFQPEKQSEPKIRQSVPAGKQPEVNAPEKVVISAKPEPKAGTPVTYTFNSADMVQGGAKIKFRANIEAIQTLQKIEAENRYATPEEQAVMAKYAGWGGIPQAFMTDRAAESIGGNIGNSAPTGWETEQRQLHEILTPDEYKAARASTLTSFYTPPEVTDGVYQALAQFGFEGGNILEPSMGVGNFFAKMPEEIRDNSQLYGVELDSISGRIAQQLYPQERIQIKGFEQTNFNNNSFDVVIGNIPFGEYRVSDKAYDKHNFKIHDYFAAKAVDKVKPNGVVALVTSKFTMDKQNEKARRYLAERCDLLGAVRLPNNAFKQNAGTEVTTDILFLKKRETMTVEVPDWVHMSQTADGIPCNKYFVDNPEQDKREYIAADPSVRNFTHTIVDGSLYFRENEMMIKVAETGKTLERMMGLHKIRQAAMALIDAQAEGCSDEELSGLQKDLNAVYDGFKKSCGNITDSMNERCFRQDDDYNTLAALEVVDTEKKTVEKSEIFTKRTVQPTVEITSVDTPQEALQVSLDRIGRVDIAYMAKLVGCELDKVITDLGNEIFRNPAKIRDDEPFSGYEDASEYLSGNVREKLQIAQNYAKHIDGSFERNISALEKVVPKDLEASEISVRIGSNWIDLEDYNKFLSEYAKADTGPYGHPVIRTKIGEYTIGGKYQDKSIAANETYGTSRMSSYHIFENLLNQRDIIVRDRREDDGKVWYEVNAKETQLAKEKARQMKDAFKTWVWADIDRREKYVDKYNNLFNGIRGREYDGSHQSFPGMNPSIKLKPHQKNAVLRAKLGGNTLLAHAVGAGKSFEMVAASMEKKRLGLINKACVVVPKHLTLQMASEWMRLYPNAKLLVAKPEDFEKNNRKKFTARCVTGDYDAVIMSFTQFERIPMSDEYRRNFMENELTAIIDALNDTDEEDRVSVKTLERQKRKLEERLAKLLSSPKDSSLCFEKLGFDYLVTDEAHNYKNCYVASKMSSVAGVQTTAAQKSEDMLMKTEYLNEKYGCNNILLATGTPVSNSMVELYVMQRYMRPDLLRKADVEHFDDWAGTFGEVVSQLEMKPAGDGFRLKNRFSKFVNIPELMKMYKESADIQTADMLDLPVPKLKTGKPIVVTAKPDERQKAYMKELAARAERMHNGKVDLKVDNMLKVTHEARLLGLDSRCIFPKAEPSPDSKVSKLLDNLENIYHETAEQKGVQIVFCDIAINEDSEHFSVYEAIKSDLVKRGIPREEICFAGDAKTDRARVEMFEKLRKGEKRFILASTSKLGTGANIQNKICAIHHLDIPWKPSDLIQQDGRGVRQGNNFDEVGVYHYLTEETFDGYMMGIITNKAKFINQIMTSKDPVRVAEDVDEMVVRPDRAYKEVEKLNIVQLWDYPARQRRKQSA